MKLGDIEKGFYNNNYKRKTANNVGQLIKQLQKLPESLPISQGADEGCELIVYNISDLAMCPAYLSIKEPLNITEE